MPEQARNSWDRRPGEPVLWFNRFRQYMLQGPPRSILAVVRAVLGAGKMTVPGAWYDASVEWEWVRRCEAWDVAEYERNRAAEEEAARREILRHQQSSRDFARAQQSVVQKVLSLLVQRALSLRSEDFTPDNFDRYLKAVAQMGETALNAEAHSIKVGELLRQLDGLGGRPIETLTDAGFDPQSLPPVTPPPDGPAPGPAPPGGATAP